MMKYIQMKDVIAAIILIGIFILRFHGVDGQLDSIGALVVGYYFGHRVSNVDSGK